MNWPSWHDHSCWLGHKTSNKTIQQITIPLLQSIEARWSNLLTTERIYHISYKDLEITFHFLIKCVKCKWWSDIQCKPWSACSLSSRLIRVYAVWSILPVQISSVITETVDRSDFDTIMFVLLLYIWVNNFSVMLGRFPIFLGLTSTKQRKKTLVSFPRRQGSASDESKPLKRQSRQHQTTNFATFLLIFEKQKVWYFLRMVC